MANPVERIREFHAGAKARTVLEFDRAHPALVEATHAYVFAAPLDPGSSDFPVSGAFLPLAHQIARVLARGTAAASLAPGDRYTAPAATGTWRIEDGSGREVASQLVSEGGATRLLSAPIERPGVYRVIRGGTLRSSFAVNPAVMKNLRFDVTKDLALIALVSYTPHVLVVRAALPAATLAELIALAKAQPGKMTFGSPKRGKESSSRPARGRLCKRLGCTTVLSTYNSSTTCWRHADR